jgi:multiple sugar transport system permease protein
MSATTVDPPRWPARPGWWSDPRPVVAVQPVHLLMPMALIVLVPLVWMVITSLETLGQTRHFPPLLWPGTCSSRTIPGAAGRAVRRWFWNTTWSRRRGGGELLLCSLAAWRVRRMQFWAKRSLLPLMVPLRLVLVPVPDRERWADQPPRCASCRNGQRWHLLAAAVFHHDSG